MSVCPDVRWQVEWPPRVQQGRKSPACVCLRFCAENMSFMCCINIDLQRPSSAPGANSLSPPPETSSATSQLHSCLSREQTQAFLCAGGTPVRGCSPQEPGGARGVCRPNFKRGLPHVDLSYYKVKGTYIHIYSPPKDKWKGHSSERC